MRFIFFFVMIAIFGGCKNKEYDGKTAGMNYCKCLQIERNSGKDFFDARTKCDADLLANNRFYRIIFNENRFGRYMLFLPRATDDSAVKFMNEFNEYTNQNCCKLSIIGCDTNDILQKQRKDLDTQHLKSH